MIDIATKPDGVIFHLPADITIEIFKLVVWVDIDTINEYYRPPLTTPLTLGAVCSSWRSFVWATPSLWTIIVLQLRSRKQFNDQVDILDLWLKKSRTYPLDIWFDAGFFCDNVLPNIRSCYAMIQPYSEPDNGPSIIALQKLMEQSTRWRKFSTGIKNDIKFIEVLSQVKGRMPLLQKASLNFYRYYEDSIHCGIPYPSHTLNMFIEAPHLIECDMMRVHITGVSLPWKQIASFRGKYLAEDECLIALPQCTNLKVLQMEGISNLSLFLDVLGRLPSLQSLTLCETYRQDIDSVLKKLDLTTIKSSIVLPRLIELRYMVSPDNAFPYSLPRSTSVTILGILQQRWNPPEGVSRLNSVVIVDDGVAFDQRRDADIIDGLRALMQEGMEISIKGLV